MEKYKVNNKKDGLALIQILKDMQDIYNLSVLESLVSANIIENCKRKNDLWIKDNDITHFYRFEKIDKKTVYSPEKIPMRICRIIEKNEKKYDDKPYLTEDNIRELLLIINPFIPNKLAEKWGEKWLSSKYPDENMFCKDRYHGLLELWAITLLIDLHQYK